MTRTIVRGSVIGALALLSSSVHMGAQAVSAPGRCPPSSTKYTLAMAGGHPQRNRRLPLTAVTLWYHVGPANEEPGRTGFATFRAHDVSGSGTLPRHPFQISKRRRQLDQRPTDFDRTNYFETVPSNQLELPLDDRTAWLPARKGRSHRLRHQQTSSATNAPGRREPAVCLAKRRCSADVSETHPITGRIGSHPTSRRRSWTT